MIHLTRSQKKSLAGQIWWVDLKGQTFHAHWSAWTFLQRLGATQIGWHLTDAGMQLMQELGY